ncbi:MAG: hypothetical protein R2813_13280 [Flavobacteriales bacterium]
MLQFSAFWFAAPELLGELTLKRFEHGLKKLVTMLPFILVISIVLLFGFGLGSYGIYMGLKGASGQLQEQEFTQYYILMGGSFLVYGVFMVFYKKIQNWIGNHVSNPLIERLINQSEIRKQALIIGAILFTLGFILQFTITALS